MIYKLQNESYTNVFSEIRIIIKEGITQFVVRLFINLKGDTVFKFQINT